MKQGHIARIYVSTYPFPDEHIKRKFLGTTTANRVFYSTFEGSDPFTAKIASFNNLMDADVDAIVFTRIDAHWSKKVADYPIEWDKFNFLFPEGEGWWERARFACDNFYIWPKRLTPIVRRAMMETYCYPRGFPLVDTHGILDKLRRYLPGEEFHFISETPEISDVNSWYTCCRSGLPEDGRGGHIHPEVKERFGYK
jgi:hypothetical protein